MIMQPCETSWTGGVCRRSWLDALASGDPATVPRAAYWPFGTLVWVIMWSEILFGWIVGLLFAAVVAGLVKKD
jgi:hypothetical protein